MSSYVVINSHLSWLHADYSNGIQWRFRDLPSTYYAYLPHPFFWIRVCTVKKNTVNTVLFSIFLDDGMRDRKQCPRVLLQFLSGPCRRGFPDRTKNENKINKSPKIHGDPIVGRIQKYFLYWTFTNAIFNPSMYVTVAYCTYIVYFFNFRFLFL